MIPDTDSLSVLLSWLARTSIQSSLLIGLVLVVQAVFRDKLAPRWRYGLWLLVMARLALPWAPECQLSVYNLVPSAWDHLASAGTTADLAMAHTPYGDHLTRPASPESINPHTPKSDKQQQAAATADRLSQEHGALVLALTILWLLGAVAVFACALLQSRRLAAAVNRERPLTNSRTLQLLEQCKKEMGVSGCLTVVETSLVRSPALFGFLRPRLLLPAGATKTLGHNRLRHVFLHELAHLKRHDIAVNWIMTILQALHWFNPLVWFAFYRARSERELACDAMTLSHGREGEACEYGRTIVYLLETLSQQRRLPSLAGVLESRTQVKRRIRMIAQFKKTSGLWQALACILIVMLGGVALTNAEQTAPKPNINDKIAKLDIDNATLNDVIRTFGEPKKYVWGKKVFKKEDLPNKKCFIAVYDGGFRVFFMNNNKIVELRSERDPNCLHRGKLRVGASLDTALEVMGKPKKTVVGKKNEFEDGVLYRDINGRKGYCYYARTDKDLRLFFADNKVTALYLTRSDYGKERRAKMPPPPKGATIDEIRKDRPWIPKTTILDEKRNLKDKTDYPFTSDPEVLGTWKVVDFVDQQDQFIPGKQQWQGELDFLKGMRFDKDGTVAVKMQKDDWRKYGAKWTKGLVMHNETAPKYEIIDSGGKKYLFFQWKSGDYTIRYWKPAYYVLEKVASGGE